MRWPGNMSSGSKRTPRPKFIGGCWPTFPTTSTRSSLSSTITAIATRSGGPRLCLAGPPPQTGQRGDPQDGLAGHFLAARSLALQGRWEEARAELAAAAAVGRRRRAFPDYDLTVRRAMVEFKAGQTEAGRRWVDQALSESDDPADVYLALAIEAVRYELPFELDGLPAAVLGSLAVEPEETPQPGRGRDVAPHVGLYARRPQFSGKYAFLNDYLERVVKYVSGCSRIRWQAGDLLDVCRFFDQVVLRIPSSGKSAGHW